MRRYTITEGAKTSAGGTVIKASSNGSILGARIALEGDLVFCSGCGRQGRIACIGPRLVELWNNVPVALENDICICGCTPPPQLIPNQTIRSQQIDATIVAAHEACAARTVPAPLDDSSQRIEESCDLYFLVTDESTEVPLVDRQYRIDLETGACFEGRTDYEGKTGKISAARMEYATLHVYESDTTPINPNWDR